MPLPDQTAHAYMSGFRKAAAGHGLSLGRLLAGAAMLGVGSSAGAFAGDLSQDWGGGRLVNTGAGAGAGAIAGYGLVRGLRRMLAKSSLGSSIAGRLKLGRLALPATLLAAAGGGLSGSRRGEKHGKHMSLPQKVIRAREPGLLDRLMSWAKEKI